MYSIILYFSVYVLLNAIVFIALSCIIRQIARSLFCYFEAVFFVCLFVCCGSHSFIVLQL